MELFQIFYNINSFKHNPNVTEEFFVSFYNVSKINECHIGAVITNAQKMKFSIKDFFRLDLLKSP